MLKKKIAWITDSTAYITKELKDHPDVYIVPLSISFGDQTYEDGVDLTANELYEKIRNSKQIPKTSQPSPGRFMELYEKLEEEYETGIAVHISSQLSGTLQGSVHGARMADFPLEGVDSKSMSYPITTLLYKGMELEKEGLDVKEISTRLRDEADKSQNYILIGNLDQFYKGGRMSGAQYLLGNLLQIKPIIRINPRGEFEMVEKVRSEKKAIRRILDLFDEAYQKNRITGIQIMHGNVPAKAEEWRKELQALYPDLEIFVGEVSSTIGVHAGEGTVALTWTNQSK
ncbi:DegV family protein [Ammoniphilus sp. CFH 90114]|uniref:DegV family protein n=1 Tax=Ammoniphilus sp. CFH 90114 TaxID=2493665 RepID=UPI00100EB5B4|nr:DegV family protein [Ammoniphilus sp. CFH 90114]RXT06300.1 DegV family protein [Ammoniphilus sp. CFH 90114]